MAGGTRCTGDPHGIYVYFTEPHSQGWEGMTSSVLHSRERESSAALKQPSKERDRARCAIQTTKLLWTWTCKSAWYCNRTTKECTPKWMLEINNYAEYYNNTIYVCDNRRKLTLAPKMIPTVHTIHNYYTEFTRSSGSSGKNGTTKISTIDSARNQDHRIVCENLGCRSCRLTWPPYMVM